jgi:broad specificity phosphatase PhoE
VTAFYLIRHGACDHVGRRLAGRTPGVSLNAAGQAQAEALVERLGGVPLAAIYASPLERARQTAAPLARRAGLPILESAALAELDFGEWTGHAIEELGPREDWRSYNAFRSGSSAPAGEAMIAAQGRIVGELLRLRDAHPTGAVALVSHGDILRAALTYFLGMPLDLLLRLDIAPGSVSILDLDAWGATLRLFNHTGPLPEAGR